MNSRWRVLLLPFSWIYGLVVFVRNRFYDAGIFKSRKPGVKTICVGNLAVGGTGKTPATEYLCRLLMDEQKIAVLSRGYGRSSSGFRYVTAQEHAVTVGDEPLQLKRKLPEIAVAVDEDRLHGLSILGKDNDLVILDDAFQHRKVRPGFNLLLFDYASLNRNKLLLPAGDFRETFSGRKRAQALLVTKSPPQLSEAERAAAVLRLKPYPGQEVFFSYLHYGHLVSLDELRKRPLTEITGESLVLLTGIANPAPLLNEVMKYSSDVIHLRFPDHHTFTKENIGKLVNASAGKTVITTEKDAQRLRVPELFSRLAGVPIWYLPVSMKVHSGEEEHFTTMIRNYVNSEHL